MPLLTSNPGALITTVGGVHASRIALYVNSKLQSICGLTFRDPKWKLGPAQLKGHGGAS